MKLLLLGFLATVNAFRDASPKKISLQKNSDTGKKGFIYPVQTSRAPLLPNRNPKPMPQLTTLESIIKVPNPVRGIFTKNPPDLQQNHLPKAQPKNNQLFPAIAHAEKKERQGGNLENSYSTVSGKIPQAPPINSEIFKPQAPLAIPEGGKKPEVRSRSPSPVQPYYDELLTKIARRKLANGEHPTQMKEVSHEKSQVQSQSPLPTIPKIQTPTLIAGGPPPPPPMLPERFFEIVPRRTPVNKNVPKNIKTEKGNGYNRVLDEMNRIFAEKQLRARKN